MSRGQHAHTPSQGTPTRSIPVIWGVALFCVALLLGVLLGWKFSWPSGTLDAQAVRSTAGYQFINPLLTCNISENKEFNEYKPFEADINTLLSSAAAHGVTASVYYRDLNAGRWFGVNEDTLYSPASLMKVPLMVTYLKREESNPGMLRTTLAYTDEGDLNSLEHYKSNTNKFILGKMYTLDELVQAMVEDSNNGATSMLVNYMNPDALNDAFSDLGLKLLLATDPSGTSDFISAKSFSYIFRVLYNSTYLSRGMSEKALGYLSHAHFPEGILGGLPEGVITAQKFGERTILASDGKTVSGRELHDCGIVYYPHHPYLLCIMTKGAEFDTLSGVIRGISAMIYADVDKAYTVVR